jgi:hypothetical protein
METDTKESESTRRVIRERAELARELRARVQGARHEISVFAPELDPALFNSAELERLLAGFAARHRRNRARILVEDGDQAVRDNPRLVELCRRFSEFIEMRRVGEEHMGLREFFLFTDHDACMHQRDLTRPECLVDAQGRRSVGELAQRFQAMWERSEPVAGIRTTGL